MAEIRVYAGLLAVEEEPIVDVVLTRLLSEALIQKDFCDLSNFFDHTAAARPDTMFNCVRLVS